MFSNKDVNNLKNFIIKKCTEVFRNMIKEKSVVSMLTAKVTTINGNKYSVQIIGSNSIITNLNSYSNLPIIVGDEVLLMEIGGSLTNVFIFSKKII